ncbi:hypothetical protein EOJ36_02760 [Sandaracinomonas limnophila]|uniref:Uncharacterized protein n=1 Tax=Sandaracinomonas limnophila TaxID=1862386 RepID=A0A437PXD8_9BACT|nr:hypothetical protein [Sandaracinomonas limnophila]RVU26936.1 hypothetical protein EOJ36_02760 [Sandaracinomonas limnophila]
MDPIVIKKNILFIVIYLISRSIVSGQILEFNLEKGLEDFKPISKNSPFYYNSKANNEFENHCYVTLEKNLVKNVPIPQDIVCRNNIGIFLFKVNKYSKIEKLEYFGDLDSSIVKKIKFNIQKTENRFVKPKYNSQEQFHWFVLPFKSNGLDMIEESRNCPNYEIIKNENDSGNKLFDIINKLRIALPNFTSVTILRYKGHLDEMERKGLILHEEM